MPWRIVDFHAHTHCAEPRSADMLAAAAREHGVGRLVLLGDVLAFGYHPTPEQIRHINDDTMSAVARFADLFVGFCFLNPENPADSCRAELERCIRRGPLRGIKLEATVRARDERLDPIMRAARELGVPLLHHAWYKTVQSDPLESDPSDIAHLAFRFPDVPIVMAHLGGARVRGIQDIRPHPNIHIDTSGSQPMADLVEYAVSELGAHRVVYGSDVPGRDFSAQLGRIMGAALTSRDRRAILGGNALRLLGL